jgi:hypothetical protein
VASAGAVSLYSALYERWHKRNLRALESVNPRNLDLELYGRLCREYSSRFTQGRLDGDLVLSELEGDGGRDPSEWDEWRHCGIERAGDIRDLLVRISSSAAKARRGGRHRRHHRPVGVRACLCRLFLTTPTGLRRAVLSGMVSEFEGGLREGRAGGRMISSEEGIRNGTAAVSGAEKSHDRA